jgi:hypothetical protein
MNHKLFALAVTSTILGGLFVSNIPKRSFSQSNIPPAPPSQKICEQPVPWQSLSSSSETLCKDIRSPQVSVNQGVVTLSFCGYPVWSYFGQAANGQVDEAFNEVYKASLAKWVKSQVGSRICCDRFQDASRKGQTCNPRVDVDCDGKPNGSDSLWSTEVGALLPDINIFRKAEGALIDRFPPGLDPDDPNFMPAADKCDCKWELVEGTLTCSPDAKQPHVYQARWRCQSTGNELFTRKEARANAPCSKP